MKDSNSAAPRTAVMAVRRVNGESALATVTVVRAKLARKFTENSSQYGKLFVCIENYDLFTN